MTQSDRIGRYDLLVGREIPHCDSTILNGSAGAHSPYLHCDITAGAAVILNGQAVGVVEHSPRNALLADELHTHDGGRGVEDGIRDQR
ncbi:hypothetical protein B0920_08460 [Massilia sp. KIM]|nr:hypothetical protein B0920_08460 [Massilia sp. KIM]